MIYFHSIYYTEEKVPFAQYSAIDCGIGLRNPPLKLWYSRVYYARFLHSQRFIMQPCFKVTTQPPTLGLIVTHWIVFDVILQRYVQYPSPNILYSIQKVQ